MESSDALASEAIYYADLLTAKVVEGIRDFPSVAPGERQAMLELVAAKLTDAARTLEALHASE